ncbi:MAG TPA: sialate O-acetylesterase [Parafilimonas sp.]|nr:sialate O-acetylesterase [Parafilimonas sp.]
MKRIPALLFCLLLTGAGKANIILPSVISDNMILQQKDSVKLWGWSDIGEIVWVTTSWDNHTYSTATTPQANWHLKIKTPGAGGPFKLTFKGNNTIVLNNVLIGEVWVCSGQSNMQMSYNWGIKKMKSDFESCYNNNIRFFQIPVTSSEHPQDNCHGGWSVCDTNSLRNFSAVAYYFGKRLNENMNVPVGLINASWGSTSAEVWMPSSTVNNDPIIKQDASKIKPTPWCPVEPGVVYNAMIYPLTNYTLQGVIWYQGEANTDHPGNYSKVLTTMINAWRKDWKKQMPFYYVQIAPYDYGDNLNGAILREQQTKAMKLSNTGMVVITDLVDDTANIHPGNKKDVGLRLANWALAKTYDRNNIVYASPMYKNMKIENGKAVIRFDFNSSGLTITGSKIAEIYIAGSDKIFYPASADIDEGKLVVWSDKVKNPMAVRYAFRNAAIGNLFSKDGLPVAPFRTDHWETDEPNYTIAYEWH